METDRIPNIAKATSSLQALVTTALLLVITLLIPQAHARELPNVTIAPGQETFDPDEVTTELKIDRHRFLAGSFTESGVPSATLKAIPGYVVGRSGSASAKIISTTPPILVRFWKSSPNFPEGSYCSRWMEARARSAVAG